MKLIKLKVDGLEKYEEILGVVEDGFDVETVKDEIWVSHGVRLDHDENTEFTRFIDGAWYRCDATVYLIDIEVGKFYVWGV